ncbi:MAG: hypothetical protein Q8L90_05020 [Bacteroidota bacterium]|nr:hypothetical protein [Bacteroidota bacterium]
MLLTFELARTTFIISVTKETDTYINKGTRYPFTDLMQSIPAINEGKEKKAVI